VDARAIRVNGTLGRFEDYVTFYDSHCVPRHPLISVIFDHTLKFDTQDEIGRRVQEIVTGSASAVAGNIHVDVSAVGFFRAIPSAQRNDYTELQYEFRVQRIERMNSTRAISANVADLRQ
jgi:hypothetical protein